MQASSEPADAYVTMTAEGQATFQGFQDPLNMDVCWNPSLPPIWVEATRRALLAWNAATPWVRFRSFRPVSSLSYPAGCDVFVNNELADYDTTTPSVDPATGELTVIQQPDGIVSDSESRTRASGGRSFLPSGTGAATTWSTLSGYVRVNSRATQMQGRTERDLLSFQSTMLHELGHVLGLDHSLATDSVMTVSGNRFQVPQADDIAGLSFIYTKVTAVQPAAEPLVTSDPVTSMTDVYWAAADVPVVTQPIVTEPVVTEPVGVPADAAVPSATAAGDAASGGIGTGGTGTDGATSESSTLPGAAGSATAEPGDPDNPDTDAGADTYDADADDTDSTDASPTRTEVVPPSALSIVAIEAGLLLCLFALVLLALRRRRRRND